MDESELNGRSVLIAGGGFFGTRAAEFAKRCAAKVVVVDPDPSCRARGLCELDSTSIDILERVEPGKAAFHRGEAVDFILRSLDQRLPDLIIPSIPGHMVGRVVERWLIEEGRVPKYNPALIKAIRGSFPADLVVYCDLHTAVLVTSYMRHGERCRTPCSQPADRCPETGRQKKGLMYRLLDSASGPLADFSTVLVSRPLGQVAGCLEGRDICSLLSALERAEQPYTLAIGTACGCHGILNAFAVE